jgi:hypothetical protein
VIRAGLPLTIGDGRGTLFWLDLWLYGGPLRVEFPELFAICVDHYVSVAEVAISWVGSPVLMGPYPWGDP